MTPSALRSLDELLFHFRSLARKAPSDWERSFARSILRASKRPSWQPSDKQLRIMHRMVADMFVAEPDLIDTGMGGHHAA